MDLIVDGPVIAKAAEESQAESRATRAIPTGNESRKRPHDPDESQPRSAKRVAVESDGVIWDLATAILPSGTSNTDRTATIPFMALKLLSGERTTHMFRHDVESFIWLFLWVCGCSDGSKREVLVAPYKLWRKLDMLACEARRARFLFNVDLKDINISEHHAPNSSFCFFLARLLLRWMNIPKSVDHKFQEQKDMAFIKVLLPEFREVRAELNRRFWSGDEVYPAMCGYIHGTVSSILKSY